MERSHEVASSWFQKLHTTKWPQLRSCCVPGYQDMISYQQLVSNIYMVIYSRLIVRVI